MDITRKSSAAAPPVDSDQEDWDLEILQALVSPSTAEDAALACAAAWMNFVKAERVAVAIFESPRTCIVAHGQREDSHLTIYVGRESAHVSSLLHPGQLFAVGGPCTIDQPSHIMCWPEHLSAVMVLADDAQTGEDRLELVQNISRQLLSRWTTPRTSFANPSHMEAMAEFAAGAGHEINNPLGSIVGQAQLLLKREDRPEQQQALETIGAQAWRIRDMIGDAMLFARPPQPEFSSCNVTTIVAQTVDTLRTASAFARCEIVFDVSDTETTTFGDEAQLATLVTHLIRNACEAVQDNEGPQVVQVHISVDTQGTSTLSIEDNGPEMSATVRQHLFDPFYSGRQAGRGLGFGLCHCWQIARMHNGILMQESLPQGNRFLVVLPAEDRQAFRRSF